MAFLMVKTEIKAILVIITIVAVSFFLSILSDNKITGDGILQIGECIESDGGINQDIAGYCQDGSSFKTDSCGSTDGNLLEWYCNKGWCESTKINCKDSSQTCQFAACED
mgnify:CR=1 FL=1